MAGPTSRSRRALTTWSRSAPSSAAVRTGGNPGAARTSATAAERAPITSAPQLLEEVVALVVHEHEGREVLDLDPPDGLHPELRVVDALHLLDVLLRQDRGRAADRAEVEAAVLPARLGD